MNKQERKLKGFHKFKKRLKNFGYKIEDVVKEGYNLFCFKTTGKPCSCNLCKRPRYKRNKNKKASE